MSRRCRQRLLSVVAGLAALSVGAANAQDLVFRASADLVAVDVSVRRAGRPVIDLKTADFDLVDNGVPQTIASLSFEKLPIDVTIALDVSESVGGPLLTQLRRAIQQVRSDLAPQDRLKVLTFNMRVKRAVDFTQSAQAIDAAFDRVAPGGSTAIFDTLAVALTSAAPADRRQLILLFSDGNDTSSITEPTTLLAVAQRTTATVGFVLPLPTPPLQTTVQRSAAFISAPVTAERIVYAALAKETGGLVVSPIAGEDLTGAFKRALDDFRTSYVLHFTPAGVTREGVHVLDVRVRRPSVDVRARKSYAWR